MEQTAETQIFDVEYIFCNYTLEMPFQALLWLKVISDGETDIPIQCLFLLGQQITLCALADNQHSLRSTHKLKTVTSTKAFISCHSSSSCLHPITLLDWTGMEWHEAASNQEEHESNWKHPIWWVLSVQDNNGRSSMKTSSLILILCGILIYTWISLIGNSQE